MQNSSLNGPKNFIIRPDTLNLIEAKVGASLELIGGGKDFLNRKQLPQELGKAINKWDLMKLKNFCTAKDLTTLTKQWARMKRDFYQVLI